MAPELMPPAADVAPSASAIAAVSASTAAVSDAVAAAMDSSAADERRARHRVLVKRAYHQKLSALQALRAHERELDAQCRALRNVRASLAPPLDVDGGAVLRDVYARLTAVREELERENRALQRLARAHEHFSALLAREARACDGRDRPGAAPYVTITPLTVQQCADVIRVAYASALGFLCSKDTLSLGSEVFGWTHRYRFRDGGSLLQYSIGKTFPSASACALCERGWEIMTSAREYRELHSASVATARIHVVQRVDRDNAVLFRVLRRRGRRTLLKTLLLASRFQESSGYMTIFRALDRHAHGAQQHAPDDGADTEDCDYDPGADGLEGDAAAPPVVWLDMFAWTRFEDTARGVRFEFGGSMAHSSHESAQFWMLEVLLLALRWESKAVGPLFTLTP